MEENSEGEDHYESDFYEYEHEESHGWTDEEEDYEAPPWPGDMIPSHESESEVESEPPGYSHHDNHQRWYQEEDETQSENVFGEEERYEEVDSEREEEKPWCEMPYSGHEEEHQEEINSQCSQEIAEEKEVKSVAGRDDFGEAYIEEDEEIAEEPRYMQFSGHEQGPEAYLRWEEDMEYWLRSQHIPKEKKLSHALDTLVGEAQTWWIREEAQTSYHKPVINWGNLKQRMYREFVQKSHNKSYIPKRLMFQTAPKSRMSTPEDASSPEPRKTPPPTLRGKAESHITTQPKEEKPKPKAVISKQSPSPNLGPHDKVKCCKSSKLSKPKYIICYRCHKGGHFAANCPTRQLEKSTSLMSKSEISAIQTSFDNSYSSIILLSMPKVDNTGPIMEHEVHENTKDLRLKKKPPETASQLQVSNTYELINYCETLILTSSLQHDVLSPYVPSEIPSLLSLGKFDNNFIAPMRFMNQSICLNTQLIQEQRFHQTKICLPVYSYSMTVLMHLIFAKRVQTIAGTKEEPPDIDIQTQFRARTKTTTPLPLEPSQDIGLVHAIQLKGEPPDAPRIQKPSPYQGKTLNSQRRMKANLLSLGADCTVSRSKHFQGGGYDEDINSASTKEHGGDTIQMTNTLGENKPERTKDIYAFIEAYQPNQNWKTTVALFFPCLGFFPMGLPRKVFNEAILSHQRISEKWNGFKIFQHEEDIQVTSQQTSNEPGADKRILIGDFRPNQKELSYEPTCSGILVHHRIRENWNHTNTSFGWKDIQFLNQGNLDLPYLESLAITLQQLYSQTFSHDLKLYYINQKVPRHSTFAPKLSRLKHYSHFLILPIWFIKSQRLVSFNLVRFVSCFSSLGPFSMSL